MTGTLLKSLAGVAILAAAPAIAQTSYDTTVAGGGDIYSFGVPDTSTYGQVFTVGADNVLNSFSMFLDNQDGSAGTANFKGYLYAWDGSKATGPQLYASGVQTYSGGGLAEFDFSTGSLGLTSGQQYVAFLSTSGLQAGQDYSSFGMPVTFSYGSSLVGGGFVYYNTGDNFDVLTSSGWDLTFDAVGDAWFKASFNGAVPEPASWALMLIGFGAIGGTLRSRRLAVRFA